MADTLPDNANELVAKACEFTFHSYGPGVDCKEWNDHCGMIESAFDPKGDDAAAVFVADAYADLRECDLELYREREKDGTKLYWCKFENIMECRGPTRCFAICRAIIEAEKVRTK